jgi:FdhD protein
MSRRVAAIRETLDVRPVVVWNGREAAERRDELAEEQPLEIRVRGRAVSVTMRTPGHDEELAAGFLLSEGVVRGGSDIVHIRRCPDAEDGNVVDALLALEVGVDLSRLTRHVFLSSSCGVCGKATIDAVCAAVKPLERRGPMVDAAVLARMPDAMRRTQACFERTGGLHAAALFDADGRMLVLREDVGRHNAVDKVLGHALLAGWPPLDGRVLLVSGRASFEIVQKALAGRVPVVAAVSAPSTLAASLADEAGQTLIGFLRAGRMNVYTHPGRVRFLPFPGE